MSLPLSHATVLRLKELVYGRRGEPFSIAGMTLRYLPGTRPVRLRYATSPNVVNRHDAIFMQVLAKELGEGDVALDVGSHAGQYAILMAALCGQTGHVAAFEPDPYAREQLERNIALNPNLKPPTVEGLAVSDAPGEAVLFSQGGNANSSLARSGIGNEAVAAAAEQIRVPLTTLDAYMAEKALPIPKWVKIDTEGAEIHILKGATRLLASEANIACELHPYAWAEFGDSFDELRQIVARAGRRIRFVDETQEIGAEPRYGIAMLERLA